MRKPTDKELAIATLAGRGAKLTYMKMVRRNPRRYLVLYVYMAFAIAFLAYVAVWPAIYLVIGMLLGSVVRDMAWIKSVNNSSAFYEKVIDWDKVQAHADSD